MKYFLVWTLLLGCGGWDCEAGETGSIASHSNQARTELLGDRTAWEFAIPYPLDSANESGIGPYDVDWARVTLAHSADRQTLYVRYELNGEADIVAFPAFYNLFIDADNNRKTGYIGESGQFAIGADYLVQGANVFAFTGGGQTDFAWSLTLGVQSDVRSSNRDIVIAIPVAGIGRPSHFRFMLFGDNALSGHVPDYYPDNGNEGEAGGSFEYLIVEKAEGE